MTPREMEMAIAALRAHKAIADDARDDVRQIAKEMRASSADFVRAYAERLLYATREQPPQSDENAAWYGGDDSDYTPPTPFDE